MEAKSNDFIAVSDIAIQNPNLQEAVSRGTGNQYNGRLRGMFEHSHEHGNAIRQQAAEAKRRALRQLPQLLERAENRLTENGFKVLWAVDAEEANQHVLDIAAKHDVKTVTKSKSMLSEELGINDELENSHMRVVETDLGEYIIQLNNEPPSHIVAPVIHRTKQEIRDIFIRELDMESTDDAGEMVAFARQKLRDDFLQADMGISGGNFIISETGTLVLVMNEGNGRMVTTMPRIHIALVGIEKVIDTADDWTTLAQALTRSATGQKLSVYTNVLNGPRRDAESDGPDEVYVIFVDNGRSDIYAQEDYAEVLTCIRCGACQNACPVFRLTGGHAYGWVYGGPIGAVLTPLFVGMENAKPLPQASSLCGACKEACPVDIDIPRMLLKLRQDTVQKDLSEKVWDRGIKAWSMGMSAPWRYELGGKAARVGQNLTGGQLPGVLGNWTQYRDFPDFAPQSFRQMWRERQKGGQS